jgi:pyruvate,water dikinase
MLDGFLRKFGHRGLYETDVESPRYSENPASVLRIVKNYLDAGATNPEEIMERQKKIREDAVSRVLKHIQKNRLKKKIFLIRLKNYERFLALREENRYHIVMVIALARRVYLEIGRRFAERGILEKQHDIFFLTIHEVQSLLTGEKNDFKNVVNERKSEKEKNSRLHVPDVIAGDVVPEAAREKAMETKKVFEGYAASPGIVQGRARIIHSPEEFGRFKPGEILVAPTTDPMWSSLFPVAKAVVTEMGGILSHAAIVAREYGTPCVVNVKGIIDALNDGEPITVDGDEGKVYRGGKLRI